MELENYSFKEISYNDDDRKMINEFMMFDVIGKGSYSKVKLAYNTEDKKYYAIKIINKNLLKKKKKGFTKDHEGNMMFIYMLEDALNEIEILKRLNKDSTHKNVIKLHQVINYENPSEGKSKIYLVLEYCKRGSLMNYNDRTGVFSINKDYSKDVEKKEDYTEEEIKSFVRDMAEGLDYIHRNNVIHRDIKTDNVLIDENGVCKFIDYSIASVVKGEDSLSKTEGNMYFYPPEFCGGKKMFKGKPVDIWALGVTTFILVFRKLPFIPDNPSNLIELFKLIEAAKLIIPEERKISPEFVDFLQKVLEKDPEKRLSASEILSHTFLKKQESLPK